MAALFGVFAHYFLVSFSGPGVIDLVLLKRKPKNVVDGICDEGDAEAAELIDGQEDVSRASRRARAKSRERAAIVNCPSCHGLRSDDGATTLGVS